MADSRVQIDRMLLRVPATDRQHGVDLARDIARELARALPSAVTPRALGVVRLSITAAPGASTAELARRVAAAVARSLT